MLSKADYSSSPWRQKYLRAEFLKNQLIEQLQQSASNFPPAVQLEKWDGKFLRYRLTVSERPVLNTSLVLGDSLHNYHSALDSLYFAVLNAVADRNGKTIPEQLQRKLSFPIWKSEDKFETTYGLLDFGNDALIEDLRRHQPFNSGINEIDQALGYAMNHPLEQLRELSNKDKHRTLNIVYTYLDDFALFHEAGIEVEEFRNLSNSSNPSEYIFEFKVKNGRPEQAIELIPKFLTGVSHIEGAAPTNSIQNMLGLISNLVFDYMNLIEYHFENELKAEDPPRVKS